MVDEMHTALRKAPKPNLVEVRLYGHLRRRFGPRYKLDVRTPGEAVHALCCVVPGFRQHVGVEHSAPGYKIFIGDEQIDPNNELDRLTNRKVIKIVPHIAGSKEGGLFGIILGAALIAFAVLTAGAGLAAVSLIGVPGVATVGSIAMSLGISMVLGGISQMMTKAPDAPKPAERPENLPSYIFNGAVNTTAQGNAVPVLYGRMEVGSQVISSGLSTSQMPYESPAPEAAAPSTPTVPDGNLPDPTFNENVEVGQVQLGEDGKRYELQDGYTWKEINDDPIDGELAYDEQGGRIQWSASMGIWIPYDSGGG
jgi:predicted phage tail protein